MSGALAIASVTAVLKDMLNEGLLDFDLSSIGSFSVTALPPDRVTTGQNEPNQLNLFLYQVTPNLGWRNEGLPASDSNGSRVGSPPLALDLHYLLTAYGAEDLNAEVLLGFAMQLFHETPLLTRDRLRLVLEPSPFGTLTAVDLADQIELIKITPVFLGTEDLSKMWTAMQARYRPTMAYMASVVLIEGGRGARVAPPVLRRGQQDRGPVAFGAPIASLSGVRPAASHLLPAARLGDDLIVTGSNLVGPGPVVALLEHTRGRFVRELVPAAGGSPTMMTVHVPDIAEDAAAMHDWAVGVYDLSLRVTTPDALVWTTNSVPIALAPRITINPLNAVSGNVDLSVTCTPRLRADQHAGTRLIFGTRQLPPTLIDSPNDQAQQTTLTFTVPGATPGDYVARLRVEGIDSLPVTLTGSPATIDFDPEQRVTVT